MKDKEVKKIDIEIYRPKYEIHELLHTLGLVDHYGLMMKDKFDVVDELPGEVINDKTATDRLKDLYNLE